MGKPRTSPPFATFNQKKDGVGGMARPADRLKLVSGALRSFIEECTYYRK